MKERVAPRESNVLTVSVIVTTCNSSAFLDRALASISLQERLPDEVLLVDDGSADDTVAVSDDWASRQSFTVRLLDNAFPHHPLAGRGPAPGKNTALAVATTDLVALLDHDDEMLPSHIRRTASALEQHGDVELCFGDAIECWSDGRTRPMLDDAPGLRALPYEERRDNLRVVDSSFVTAMLPGSRIPTAANMWRRTSALGIGGFSARVSGADDWLFFLSLSRRGRVAYFPEPIARKHTHASNMGHPQNALRTNWNCFDAMSLFLETPETWNLQPSEIAAISRRRAELATEVCWTASAQGVSPLVAAYQRLPAGLRPHARDWLRALRATLTRST